MKTSVAITATARDQSPRRTKTQGLKRPRKRNGMKLEVLLDRASVTLCQFFISSSGPDYGGLYIHEMYR